MPPPITAYGLSLCYAISSSHAAPLLPRSPYPKAFCERGFFGRHEEDEWDRRARGPQTKSRALTLKASPTSRRNGYPMLTINSPALQQLRLAPIKMLCHS